MNHKLLITGGAGFVGANFAHYWANKYPQSELFLVDKLTYAGDERRINRPKLPAKHQFIQADINDQGLISYLLQHYQIDTILHLAAESHIDRSITHPAPFVQTNIVGTFALLEAARQVWLKRKGFHHFHYASSDNVFGATVQDQTSTHDSVQYRTNSPYAASKAAGELLLHSYQETYGLKATVSHLCNLYGPFQHEANLIPKTIRHILLGNPIPVYGDGQQQRQWLFVQDGCRGIEHILQQGRIGEHYAIAQGHSMRNLQLVNLICQGVDDYLKQHPHVAKNFPRCPVNQGESSSQLIQHITDRPGHDIRHALDDSKLQTLGYKPMIKFGQGLKMTIMWFIEHWSCY